MPQTFKLLTRPGTEFSDFIVATKMDAADPKKVQKLQRWSKKNNLELLKISSVTGEGLDDLKRAVFAKLNASIPKSS